MAAQHISCLDFGDAGNLKVDKLKLGSAVPAGYTPVFDGTVYLPCALARSDDIEVLSRKLLSTMTFLCRVGKKRGITYMDKIDALVYNTCLHLFPQETYKQLLLALRAPNEGAALHYFVQVRQLAPKLQQLTFWVALSLSAVECAVASELPQDSTCEAATDYISASAQVYGNACSLFGTLEAHPILDMAVEALDKEGGSTDEETRSSVQAWVQLMGVKDLTQVASVVLGWHMARGRLAELFTGNMHNVLSLLLPLLRAVLPGLLDIAERARDLGLFVPIWTCLADMTGGMELKLLHSLRECQRRYSTLYVVCRVTVVLSVARSKPELRKGLLDLIDVMGPMRKILGVLCPSDTIAQPTFRELLGDLQAGATAVAANSESLATLEASMRGICSNMLRLQADTERLQEDFNSLHAREDDQAHIAELAGKLLQQVKAVLGKAEEVLTRPKSPSAAELERLGGEMAALQAIVASMGATVREHSAAVEVLKASAGGAAGSGNGPAAGEAGAAVPPTPSVAALVERLERMALGQRDAAHAAGGSRTARTAAAPTAPGAVPAAPAAAEPATAAAAPPLSPLRNGYVKRGAATGAADKRGRAGAGASRQRKPAAEPADPSTRRGRPVAADAASNTTGAGARTRSATRNTTASKGPSGRAPFIAGGR